MKIAIKFAAAALVLLASAPAFAHGGGMGHMGGNMSRSIGGNLGGNLRKTSRLTVVGMHHHVHRTPWGYIKTTKTTDRIHIVRLKTLSPRQVLRIERQIGQIRLELFKLSMQGSQTARSRCGWRNGPLALSQLVNGTPNFN